MITLKVMGRCHNRPEFEADTNKDIFYGDDVVIEVNTEIHCKNESLRNTLMNFLKKKNAGGKSHG